MASPATATFLAAWRRQSVKPALLVQVDLTVPTSRTIYLSNIPITTPGGQIWEPMIHDCEPIEAPGAFLSTGPDLCTTTLILFNKRLSYQTAPDVLVHSFNDYLWEGATITFWFWEQSLTDIADRFQVFKGVVSHYEPDQALVRVPCIQRSDWNRTIAPSFVTRGAYPRAPEKSIGLPIPLIFGNGHARPMRGDWAGTIATDRDRFDRAGGAIPTVKGVLVDTGAGASGDKARVVFASHDLDSFGNPAAGTNFFLKTNSEHPSIWVPAGGDINNSSGEARFDIPDAFADAFAVIVPTDVLGPATPASEPRYALDVGNELTYALLDYDASKRELQLPLLSVDPPGEYVDARLVLGYKTVGGATGLRLIFRNDVLASERTDTISASTTPTTMYGGSIVGHEPATPWDFSQCQAHVNFDGGVGTGVKCHVYFIALEIEYKPRREFLRMARRVETRTTKFGVPPQFGKNFKAPRGTEMTVQHPVAVDFPVTEFQGEFFGNANGKRDTAGGIWTGTALAVIERPHDIANYLLQTYLEQTSGQVNSGTGLHGDLILLDTPLGTWNNKNQVYFLKVDREMAGEEAIVGLARDALAWFHISRFTDKWHGIAWKAGAGVVYDLTLKPEHIVGDTFLRARPTPKSRVLTGVRLRYLWDEFRKAYMGEIRVAHDGSSAGYHYDHLRDQYMTVVTGENDKLDYTSAGPTYGVTLAAGDYDDETLLTEVYTKATAASGGLAVGWGSRIVASVNDKLYFNDGAAKTATLTAGLYATMGALATHVAAQMNAVSTLWSCSYSATTLKFTISRSAGTATLSFTTPRSCAATLGFTHGSHTGSASYTSEFAVECERFVMTGAAAIVLLFESGTNGLNGTRTDCAELLGFSNLRDTVSALGIVAPCPKNNREQACLQAKERYGGRRTLPIDADNILDTDTAREVANRIVDLEAEPRILLEFDTTWMPDLERGRVLSVSSEFDTPHPYPKYASDGSWAAKTQWVLSTRQHAVRRWHMEVSCIEAD